MRKLHEKVKLQIEKKNESYAMPNKGRKKIVFNLGIWYGYIWERKGSHHEGS